jgi:hypothetical protein
MTPEQERALVELSQKTRGQIQTERARTWAFLAWGASKLAASAKDRGDWLMFETHSRDANEYEHEAIEHAALASDDVLRDVRRIMAAY